MVTARKHVLFPNLGFSNMFAVVSVPVDREHIYSCDIPTIQYLATRMALYGKL